MPFTKIVTFLKTKINPIWLPETSLKDWINCDKNYKNWCKMTCSVKVNNPFKIIRFY